MINTNNVLAPLPGPRKHKNRKTKMETQKQKHKNTAWDFWLIILIITSIVPIAFWIVVSTGFIIGDLTTIGFEGSIDRVWRGAL